MSLTPTLYQRALHPTVPLPASNTHNCKCPPTSIPITFISIHFHGRAEEACPPQQKPSPSPPPSPCTCCAVIVIMIIHPGKAMMMAWHLPHTPTSVEVANHTQAHAHRCLGKLPPHPHQQASPCTVQCSNAETTGQLSCFKKHIATPSIPTRNCARPPRDMARAAAQQHVPSPAFYVFLPPSSLPPLPQHTNRMRAPLLPTNCILLLRS